MPISHTINEKIGVVVSSWVGKISDAEVIPSYKQLYENKQWSPGFHEIGDLRNANMSSVSSKTLGDLTTMVEGYTKGKCQGFKTAVIAPMDLPFGIARMYEALSCNSPETVMVFRDLNKAFEWLSIDDQLLK